MRVNVRVWVRCRRRISAKLSLKVRVRWFTVGAWLEPGLGKQMYLPLVGLRRVPNNSPNVCDCPVGPYTYCISRTNKW